MFVAFVMAEGHDKRYLIVRQIFYKKPLILKGLESTMKLGFLRAYPETRSESEKDGFYGSDEGFF